MPVLLLTAAVAVPAVVDGAARPPAESYPRVRGTTVTVKNDLFFVVRHGGAVTAARLTADPRRGRGEELDRLGQAVLFRWFRRPAETYGFHYAGPAVTTGTGHAAEAPRDGTADLALGPLLLIWSGAGGSPQSYLYFTQLEGPAEIYPEQFRTLRDADRLDPARFVPVDPPAPPADESVSAASEDRPDGDPGEDGPGAEVGDREPGGPGVSGTDATPPAGGEDAPSGETEGDRSPEFKGLTVGVRHDAFLLVRHAGFVTAVRLSPDPARANLLRGFAGVDYRWYRRPAETPFFLPVDALPPGAAGNAAVTGGAGRAADGTGAAVRAGDLRVPWSMGGAKSSWLYFQDVDGAVEVYQKQFTHLIDADDLAPDLWTTLRPEPVRSGRPAGGPFGNGFRNGFGDGGKLGRGGF